MITPRTMAAAAVGRTMPNSLEAEEALLSCCLLDGADVVSRCLEARIKPESFYDSKHGIVFEKLLDLYNRQVPIDVSVVAEELKTARQLDQVGGYAFLTQVSSLIPTTAQAGYFIEKVREQAVLREIIRSATGAVEDCYNFSGGIEDFVGTIESRFTAIARARFNEATAHEMQWDALLKFNPKADPDCLMGNRFLGRTGACVIVAPSGVGKSVLALQLAASATLGRHFFGLQMTQAMRTLYLQAEDDHGDVAEAVQGFVRGSRLGDEDIAALKARMRIERWNDAAGEKFLTRLRRAHQRWPFDLVVVNPLFSFCGCNVSEQSELSPFLRNGLNTILNETRSAAVVVHHTNKPPANDKKPSDVDEEIRYAGSGSAELTNWARAYITLKGCRGAKEGVHKMTFAKRGMRAGLVDDQGQATTKVFIEHSPRGEGLFWLPSSHRPDTPADGQFQMKFNLTRALSVYDSTRDWRANEAAIAVDQGLNAKTVRRHQKEIEEAGL